MDQTQHDFDDSPVAQGCGEEKDYSELIGTPFKVFLANGITHTLNEKTGKVMTEITDLPGLIACVLQARVLHSRKLSGDDLKFIRVALRMRSSEVAEVLDVSPEHYSRCETGTKTLSSSTEKFFRMWAFLQADARDKSLVERVAKMKKENVQFDPEEVKKAMNAFQRVFFDMKIKSVYRPNDELKFCFVRRIRDDHYRGKDDGVWEEPEKIAA